MTRRCIIGALAAAVAAGIVQDVQGADRVWGLHFDFHASPAADGNDVAIGSGLKEGDIAEICDLLKPDFLQIDCKGHPGWASYPSKLGNAMPKFAGDPLKVWRRVTAAKGVGLYMHYSGIFDARYCKENPAEATMNAKGVRTANVKPDGRYADDLLIPQLCELAGDYGVDGVWVDGDCWAVECDYDPKAVAAFEKATGIDLKGKVPVSNDDPHFDEFREYYRGLFRAYLNRYVDAVHAKYPKFKIASNWSYSLYRPDDIDARVNFVSGDLASTDSYYSSRLAGRLNARHALPWDLMAWEFRYDWKKGSAFVSKHPVQLMQEAASVLSLGGGFQVYVRQNSDGSPDRARVRELKPLADFVRARAPYCFGGHARKELAVLLPVSSQYRQNVRPFATAGQYCTSGVLNLLCDAGYSTRIATESDLRPDRIGEWKVIVVPQLFCELPKATMEALVAWTRNGGRLVVTGIETCRFFAAAGFPTALADDFVENQRLFTLDGRASGSFQWSRSLKDADGEIFARTVDGDKPFAAVRPFGKGLVAVLGAEVGYSYENAGQYLQRKLVSALVDRLHPVSAKVERARGLVELTELVKDGETFVQLVNANGLHHNPKVFTEDFIPPALDVTVALRASVRPKELILRPSGAKLPFAWRDGVIRVTVPRVDLHEIIEVVRPLGPDSRAPIADGKNIR